MAGSKTLTRLPGGEASWGSTALPCFLSFSLIKLWKRNNPKQTRAKKREAKKKKCHPLPFPNKNALSAYPETD